ncbi:MAG: hypothetical protein LC792_03500 [Actinobacteria bacterium]|nr:hypothetical protein [Actinomycetota bacterium]
MGETLNSVWGSLAESIHSEPLPAGCPAFRDNAFLGFWDTDHAVVGAFHVSTSPNAGGRRARFSLSVAGRSTEVVEPLEPYSFTSPSISFDLDRRITVDGAGLDGEVTCTPLFAVADYSKGSIIPPLVPDEPLQHFQQAARVQGRATVDGVGDVTIDGFGIRDRTWGYRDESVSIAEYVALTAVFDDFALTSMRFVSADGSDRLEGYRLGAAAEPIVRMGITRDPSGLLSAGHLTIEGGEPLELRVIEGLGGFWVPMGWERRGPTMSAYDQFARIRTEGGAEGVTLTEQGVVRRIF